MTTTETTTTGGMVRVAVNPGGIPSELKDHAHWICWKAVPKEDGEGFDKVPYDPGNDKRASVTDSTTWTTFPEALEAYESGRYDGIGFVLSSGDPFVLLDFDSCRNADTGEVSEVVLAYMRRFENRYVEVSPSGTGLHLITCGKLRDGVKKGDYEAYGQERFTTVTGEVLDV